MPFDAARRTDRAGGPQADDLRAEDDALMARAAAGDGAASRTLIARHGPRALAIASGMLRDRAEAEDVAQEAMLRLWRQAPRWRPGEARVSTWLHRVTANLAVDRLRKRRRLSDETPPEIADDAPGAEARLGAADRRAALRTEIAALPERQRVALSLRHFAELSNPEIAERLEVSVEAVESLLARARRTLAKRLEDRREALGLE